MSENPDTSTEYSSNAPVLTHQDRDRRLHRTLAWVGIVAGVVFIVAVVFFAGFALGRTSGYHGWNRGYHGQMGPGTGGGCPMMGNGSTMGPGGMMDPDDMGPGMMRPGPSPASPSPAPPPR